METTSANRRPAQTARQLPLGWILGGLGIVLVVASMYFQFAGSIAWRGVVHPQGREDTESLYLTPPVSLSQGTYSFDFSYRKPPRFLEITTGRYHVSISTENAPDWLASGSLKANKKKKARGRSTVRGTVVSNVPEAIQTPLRIKVQGAEDAALSVTIRKVGFDYRILLWIGFALIALGLALDPGLRAKLQGLLGSN
jgi:hypothetical protein